MRNVQLKISSARLSARGFRASHSGRVAWTSDQAGQCLSGRRAAEEGTFNIESQPRRGLDFGFRRRPCSPTRAAPRLSGPRRFIFFSAPGHLRRRGAPVPVRRCAWSEGRASGHESCASQEPPPPRRPPCCSTTSGEFPGRTAPPNPGRTPAASGRIRPHPAAPGRTRRTRRPRPSQRLTSPPRRAATALAPSPPPTGAGARRTAGGPLAAATRTSTPLPRRSSARTARRSCRTSRQAARIRSSG